MTVLFYNWIEQKGILVLLWTKELQRRWRLNLRRNHTFFFIPMVLEESQVIPSPLLQELCDKKYLCCTGWKRSCSCRHMKRCSGLGLSWQGLEILTGFSPKLMVLARRKMLSLSLEIFHVMGAFSPFSSYNRSKLTPMTSINSANFSWFWFKTPVSTAEPALPLPNGLTLNTFYCILHWSHVLYLALAVQVMPATPMLQVASPSNLPCLLVQFGQHCHLTVVRSRKRTLENLGCVCVFFFQTVWLRKCIL